MTHIPQPGPVFSAGTQTKVQDLTRCCGPSTTPLSAVLGMQRIHHPRDEPLAGAEPDQAHLPEGDRAHGQHHPPQVQLHPDAAQAEHVRGRHDPALPVPGCAVSPHQAVLCWENP